MSGPRGINISSGVGSGEAQIISTPNTDRALYRQLQLKKQNEKVEKDKFYEALSKVDTKGAKVQDLPKLEEMRNELINKYVELNSARDRASKIKLKGELEQAKSKIELAVVRSRSAAEFDKGLSMEAWKNWENFDNDTRSKILANAQKSSFDPTYQMDFFAFMPQAKPYDITKDDNEIIEGSMVTRTLPRSGMVGGAEGVISETVNELDPTRFAQLFGAKLRGNPKYAKSKQTEYMPQYMKTEDYKQNGEDGIWQYIITQEYNTKNNFVRQNVKQSFNEKNKDFNFDIRNSFGGGGGVKRNIPNLGIEASDSLMVKEITDSTINGKSVTSETTSAIPVVDAVPFNVEYNSSLQDGYFDITNGGKFVKSNDIAKVTGARIVSIPVVELPSGRVVLAKEYAETTTTAQGGDPKKSARKPFQAQKGSKLRVVNMIEGKSTIKDSDGMEQEITLLQPLGSVAVDRYVKSDDPTLMRVNTWNNFNTLKGNNESAPKKGGGKTVQPKGKVR